MKQEGEVGLRERRLTERTNSDDSIEADQQEPLKPVTLAIGNEIIHQEDCDKQDCDLEGVEGEVHLIDAHSPADDNEKGDDEERDLHT